MPTKKPITETPWEQSAKLMFSQTYQERAKAEYYQLHTRMEKLGDMLTKYALGQLEFVPSCSFELLREQYITMRKYQDILLERFEVEGIDL